MSELKKNNGTIEIKRIVIWGLKKRYHTNRHIHKAFYANAKKLKYKTIWLEDNKKSQKYIKTGDLIISIAGVGKMLKEKKTFKDFNIPIRDDVKYCLHNFKEIFTDKLNKDNFLKLQVYSNEAEKSDIKIDEVRYFDSKTKTLYQPWGTNILKEEFKKPAYNKNKFVIWVGSIWNDKNNHGNINQIQQLKDILKKNYFRFIQVRFIPDFLNIKLIRISGLSPAIGGDRQIEVNYLPCRIFKNISYGKLTFTNIAKFKDIIKSDYIYSENQEGLVEDIIKLDKKAYVDEVLKQQEFIGKYTYKESLENIIRFLC